MRYTWTDRNANRFSANVTRQKALDRLAYLDADEARTMRLTPTDSGMVRDTYRREAAAIRAALYGSTVEDPS